MPVGWIQPSLYATRMKTNNVIEKPTRRASAMTVRSLRPLSLIMKTRADTRLAMISTNATTTT